MKIEPNRPFRFHPATEDTDLYVAIRVTASSAIVRSVGKKVHREFTNPSGKLVSFDAPTSTFTISPNAQVFYDGSPLPEALPYLPIIFAEPVDFP